MLVKSLKASPSVLLFLVFCAFFGLQLSRGPIDGPPPPPAPPEPAPEEAKESPAPPPLPEAPAPPKAPRIAVVTFITDQKSYIHISLKNKDRKLCMHDGSMQYLIESYRLRAPPWIRSGRRLRSTYRAGNHVLEVQHDGAIDQEWEVGLDMVDGL